MAHVTNGETGEAWVEVVGGRGGDRAVRSFRPDQLYAAFGPSRPRPLVGRCPRAPPWLIRCMAAPQMVDAMGHPGIPTLTTERLVLRPFEPGDLDELVAIHAEESFWWYPRAGRHDSGGDRRVLDHGCSQRYEDDGFGIEAMIERASGRMIGWAGLAVPHFLPEILPAVEVGWRLSGPYRGPRPGDGGRRRGAGLRVHRRPGSSRIVSLYEPENVASGRVMERLGFIRRVTTVGPRGEDVAVMELHRGRWEERRARR